MPEASVDPPLPAVRQAVALALAVLAGRLCAVEVVPQVDAELEVHWCTSDGTAVTPRTAVSHIRGSLRSILTVSMANSSTRVVDTRKTIPGLRALQNAAVRAGADLSSVGALTHSAPALGTGLDLVAP